MISVPSEAAMRAGPKGRPRRAVHLRVIDVEADGNAARGDGLAQAVERGIESLAGVKLRVGDEPAGVIERGMKEDLPAAAAGAGAPGAEQHVGLPDLVGEFGFELFARRRGQQLPFRKTTLFEKAIERGGRQRRLVLAGGQGQFAQQRRAGAMWVFALEAFDEAGQLWCDGARLATVLARFGGEGLEAAVAVARRPVEQRIDRDGAAFRIGDVVVAGGNLLGAAREFAAGQRLQHEWRDQTIAEQGNFFGFVIHPVFSLPT